MRTLVVLLAVVWVAGGATCHRGQRVSDLNPPPVVFESTPRIEEVIAAVNLTDAITQMQSTSTTVELLDSPLPVSRLSATLALERPRRFRLRASLPIMLGAGLDVGSNDETFWMQYPDNGVHQTLLFARHDEFQQRMAGSPLPVDPTWLIEALGLVHIDPELVTEGPVPRGDGALEVRTRVPTASGSYQRVLLIDGAAGFVRGQYLYGPAGELVASASGSEHQYYPEHRVVLPHSVQIQLQPQAGPPMGLQIEIGSYVLNQLLGEDPRLFEIPTGSHQVIDLSRLQPSVAPPPLGAVPPPGMLPPAALPPATPPPGASSPYTPPGQVPALTPAAGEPVRSYVPTASYVPTLRGNQLR
ncbi:hypothetical protein [Candidatus Laterigemmans baculatus]|uniref:hypothetical protein n=1 Tax=Candidatus Laterigemmans baculatus TaxID=2770505 RepID=UPI0013D9B54A|nr:hypothetical protein [Candidatus Laterigemmans baculatus]